MFQLYSVIAVDIARDRAREADLARRAALARSGHRARPGFVRRGLANGLAVVTRGSAAAVRRLDAYVADDLTKVLGAAK